MDIIKLPIEYTDSPLDSRFRLVLMVAQRARQLSEGSPVLVKSKYVKNITLALQEAIEGKLKYLTGEEARHAREFEFKMKRERMARENMAAASGVADRSDIKEAYTEETLVLAEEDDMMHEIVDGEEPVDVADDEEDF